MKKEKKKDKSDEEVKFPFEFKSGGLFGGLFQGLGNLIELADKIKEEGGVIQKEGEFTVPGQKDMKGVFGFTVRTMAGAGGTTKPVVEAFGNIKKTPKGPVVEEAREPIVDVFEDGDTVQIVSELPGVSENEIHYEVHGDVVSLSTTGKRKYSKEILLKTSVESEGAQMSYKNGMLELKLKKKVK
ncbi:MAG: Hsp20/alpha crystallin family protein [Chlamydiae bacterium]|nr:Hsp20/alpha crystallin family protein [Chlamydiota bacterium]MBI3277880.1 Hsp20/alpha crystallin family protein [Chlamydiota bacterium]